jgi:hypothetical protein
VKVKTACGSHGVVAQQIDSRVVVLHKQNTKVFLMSLSKNFFFCRGLSLPCLFAGLFLFATRVKKNGRASALRWVRPRSAVRHFNF